MVQFENKPLLNVQEVATVIGTSIQTIGAWYRFKLANPDDDRAKILPEFTRVGNRNTRYWKQEDLGKLLEFKRGIIQGRNGSMGAITQRYAKTNFRNKK